MNRVSWMCVSVACRMLDPEERDAVCGDFAESGEKGLEALRDVLSLAIRRQAALWKSWQRWLALVGIAGIAGFYLSEIALRLDVGIDLQLRTYLHYGVHYETGLTPGQDFIYLGLLSVAFCVWSWTCGFVLGSLSERASWLSWALFYVVVLDAFHTRLILAGELTIARMPPLSLILLRHLLPFRISSLLFLLAALWGARNGVRLHVFALRRSIILAVVIAILTFLITWTSGWYETAQEAWSGGIWRGVPWPVRIIPLAIVSWPVIYILATSWRRPRGLGRRKLA